MIRLFAIDLEDMQLLFPRLAGDLDKNRVGPTEPDEALADLGQRVI